MLQDRLEALVLASFEKGLERERKDEWRERE